MSERLSVERLEHLRKAFEKSPHWTVEKELWGHISALEAELATRRKQVEAAKALADESVMLHERLAYCLNVLERKTERILPSSDRDECRRVIQKAHLEHMHVVDAYRATQEQDGED